MRTRRLLITSLVIIALGVFLSAKSPSLTDANSTIGLNSSDHYLKSGNATPLPDSLSDGTSPDYTAPAQLGATPLPETTSTVTIPRFQGQLTGSDFVTNTAAAQNCSPEIYYILDVTGSMSSPDYVGSTTTKLQDLKKAVSSIDTELNNFGPNTEVGFLAFTDTLGQPLAGFTVDGQLTYMSVPLTKNIASVTTAVNSLSASGDTPTPQALYKAISILSNPDANIIFMTDGLPNITQPWLQDSALSPYDGTYDYTAGSGVAVADTKLEIDSFKANESNTTDYGILLPGTDDNPTIVQYFGGSNYIDTNGNVGPTSPLVTQIEDEIFKSISTKCALGSSLTISLPPSSIYSPTSMALTQGTTTYTYTFNGLKSGNFLPPTVSGPSSETTLNPYVNSLLTGPGNNDQFFQVTIQGITPPCYNSLRDLQACTKSSKKISEPFTYKFSFTPTPQISKASYIYNNINSYFTKASTASDPKCQNSTTGTQPIGYLCINTNIVFSSSSNTFFSTNYFTNSLLQSIYVNPGGPPPVSTGELTILLPPSSIYTPNFVGIFDNKTNLEVANFGSDGKTPLPVGVSVDNDNKLSLTVSVNADPSNSLLNEYVLSLSGPGITQESSSGDDYNFALGFIGNDQILVKQATVDNIVKYINAKGSTSGIDGLTNVSTEASIANTCSSHASGSDIDYPYLCISSLVSLTTPDGKIYPLAPIQENVVSSSACTVNCSTGNITTGNVAAGGSLSGFTIGSGAIAIGGTDNGVTNKGGAVLQNYFKNNGNSVLNWSVVRSQLQTSLTQGDNSGTIPSSVQLTVSNNTYTYRGNSWYLNSSTNDPTNSFMTTFSYPPEGKLWHVKGNLEFKNSTDSPLFQGLGTIVVDGNVTFDNNAVCSKGSEVGIIASGSITFNGQGGVNSAINCGAYVALNGNITLPTALSSYQSWTGIFVAGGNINLPDAVSKNAQVNINYDANLAANPPILFRSVLNILSGSPS